MCLVAADEVARAHEHPGVKEPRPARRTERRLLHNVGVSPLDLLHRPPRGDPEEGVEPQDEERGRRDADQQTTRNQRVEDGQSARAGAAETLRCLLKKSPEFRNTKRTGRSRITRQSAGLTKQTRKW